MTVELQTEGLIPEEELDIDDRLEEVGEGYAASVFVETNPGSVVVAIALLGDELPASLIAPT